MTLLERATLLADLAARLAETRRSGGRLVLLSGEAGMGKTALLDAFMAGLPRGSRVLRGGCDPVVPPRPFAPLFDMAGQLGDDLAATLSSEDRDRVFERFLAVVRRQGSGSVLIFEDLHWADSSTLDLLRIVGRRLAETPSLVIGSFRGHDIDADHPLRLMIGDIPTNLVVEVAVPPLTVEAVAALAARTGVDPRTLHEATGGNPFFVTEVLAAPGSAASGADVPSTVRDAVGARVGRLSAAAQGVLRGAAVVGQHVELPLLTAVSEGGGASAGLRECIAREMLLEHGGGVSFRHELARRAVLDAMAPTDRARLHGRALAALRSGVAVADAARLAHHAIEAGDPAAIARHVPAAAEQAARLGAHEEAADYLAIAIALPASRDPQRQAELLERYAYECSVSDRIAAARSAQESALDTWRELGDRLREGDGLRALASYMWLGGEGDRARETAEAAVDVLEGIRPRGHELAHALAKLAQLMVVSGQDDARAWSLAAQALELAEDIGDEPVAVHALTTLALAETFPGVATAWGKLEEALRRAKAQGLSDDVMRALINLVETARDMLNYQLAERFVEEAAAYLRDHEFGLYRHLLGSRSAQLALERGRWAAAEREAEALLAETTRSNQVRVRALEVLGRLRARRGEPGAMAALDQAMAIVGPGELQEICPLHAARAEAAWLAGDLETCGDEAIRGLELAEPTGLVFTYSELSFWAWRASRIERLPDGSSEPYVLHASGEHRASAVAWAAIGSPYQQAAALADSDDELDLLESLALLHALGTTVLAERVTERLRERGVRQIPRGPRSTTRSHLAGLTGREGEVLRLIRRGARNADIARQLVLSEKTVDHHVSAILRKLRVPDRASAAREADRLGLEDGDRAGPS